MILADIPFDRQWLSDLAGTASFIVWLFAQSPQLYENYKNSSCEGLSFVFLAQWMAGDATNLIGSVLTKQLPFQIAVASYFCSIDVCILIQYYYYWQRDRRLSQKRERYTRRIQHELLAAEIPDTFISESRPSMKQRDMRRYSNRTDFVSVTSNDVDFEDDNLTKGPSQRANLPNYRRRTKSGSVITTRNGLRQPRLGQESDLNYRALGDAAKSVAELAIETERRIRRLEDRERRVWAMALAEGKRRQQVVKAEEDDVAGPNGNKISTEVQDEMPSHMVSSTTSSSTQGENEGDLKEFGFASTPNIRFGESSRAIDQFSPPLSPDSHRGRGMTRTAGIIEASKSQTDGDDQQSKQSNLIRDPSLVMSPIRRENSSRPSISRSSTRRTLSSLSSRQSGMVLLGLASLFALNGPQSIVPKNGISQWKGNSFNYGNVVGDVQIIQPQEMERQVQDIPQYASFIHPSTHKWVIEFHSPSRRLVQDQATPPPPPVQPTWDMLIGRISAWTCTVLYMTSRLPQIWTNLQRKSVQGLSILLFLSAATGNLLYSISILVNPRAQSPPFSPQERVAYLMESLPFLLGSGGTLIFDAIIIVQWIFWRGKPPLNNNNNNRMAVGSMNAGMMITSTGSYNLYHHNRPDSNSVQRSRKTSVRSRWQSLERQPLLE